MKYLAVIERAKKNFSAYLPDVPGCVATGATAEEAKEALQKALAMHLAGLREDGEDVPEPKSQADYVGTP
jgi:predicted RNase H-like HicB family nuclease